MSLTQDYKETRNNKHNLTYKHLMIQYRIIWVSTQLLLLQDKIGNFMRRHYTILLIIVIINFIIFIIISRAICLRNTVSFIKGGSQGKGFKNRILSRISRPTRDKNQERRRHHKQELHNLHRSPNIVRVSISRKLRWSGLVGGRTQQFFQHFSRQTLRKQTSRNI